MLFEKLWTLFKGGTNLKWNYNEYFIEIDNLEFSKIMKVPSETHQKALSNINRPCQQTIHKFNHKYRKAKRNHIYRKEIMKQLYYNIN